MHKKLEKILNDLEKLCLPDEQLLRLKKYQQKLEELNKFIDDNEYVGTPDIMIKATQSYLNYLTKTDYFSNKSYNFLNMKFSNLGWRNEGFLRDKSEPKILLNDIEHLNGNYQLLYNSVLVTYASALLHQGYFEKCIEILDKVDTKNIVANKNQLTVKEINMIGCRHNNYGLAYRSLNENQKARDHFYKSLEILKLYTTANTFDAAKIAVLMNIGLLYVNENANEKAVEYFKTNNKYVKSLLKHKPEIYTIFHACQYLLMQSECCGAIDDIKTQSKCIAEVENFLPKVKDHFIEVNANYFYKKCLLLINENNFLEALNAVQKGFIEVHTNFKSINYLDTPKIKEEDYIKNQPYLVKGYYLKASCLLQYYQHQYEQKKDNNLLELCLDVVDEISNYFDVMRQNYDGHQTKFSIGEYSTKVYHIAQKACWFLYKTTSNPSYIEKAFTYANKSKALVLLEEMNQKWFNNSEENISISKIKSTLKNNEILIEYSVSEVGIFIYCISKTKEIQFFHLDANKAKTLAEQVKNWINYHFNIYSPAKYLQYQNDAYQIYIDLLGESFNQIKEDSTIIISPDGFLNALPFEALVYKKNEPYTYNDINYIIDRFTIGYTFSSYLLYLNRRKKYDSYSKNFLYVSPNFLGNKSLKEHQQIAMEQELLLQKASLTEMNYISVPSIDFKSGTFDLSLIDDHQQIVITKAMLENLINNNNKKQAPKTLIHNAALVKVLKKIINPSFSNIEFLENEKSTKNLFSENVDKSDYLLISSHADAENGILLYEEGKNGTTFLSYKNIIELKIKAQLVVLNMCDSGRGKSIFGEGYLSLGRAFFAAGSLNVIQTLYKVSDKYSAHLIASFFKYLVEHRLSFYSALRKAKLLLRKEKGSHPKFWAGHVIYGKNGKL